MSSNSSSPTPQQDNALSHIPLQQPPPGVVSNFGNATNQNSPMFTIDSALLGIMLLFFSNRIYTKAFIVRKYTWDDLTISIAIIGSIAYYIACIWGAQRGRLGVHAWDVSLAQAASNDLTIPSYLIEVLMPPTMLFLKLAFFVMYLHIFGPLRWLKICGIVGAIFTTMFYGITAVFMFYFATPMRGETWYQHLGTQYRHLTLVIALVQAAVGLVIDVAILLLPIIAVMQLQLPRKQKFGVIITFMTGILACLGSLLSIYYRKILVDQPDQVWNTTPVNTVTLLEMFVGIICACIPSAAKAFRHHWPSVKALKDVFDARFRRYTVPFFYNAEKGAKKIRLSGSMDELSCPSISGRPSRPQTPRFHGVRTFVQGGRESNVQDDDIHLTYEMETTVSRR